MSELIIPNLSTDLEIAKMQVLVYGKSLDVSLDKESIRVDERKYYRAKDTEDHRLDLSHDFRMHFLLATTIIAGLFLLYDFFKSDSIRASLECRENLSKLVREK